jgi:hypothetical protein
VIVCMAIVCLTVYTGFACAFYNVSCTTNVYNCCTMFVHLDVPSTSSTHLSLFLYLSSELFISCNVGRLFTNVFSPVRHALCLSPNAACSCFSTAFIFSCRVVVVAVACAAGCVEVSFSYDTVVSTSSSLDSTALSFSSISLYLAGASVFVGAAFYLVVRVLLGS